MFSVTKFLVHASHRIFTNLYEFSTNKNVLTNSVRSLDKQATFVSVSTCRIFLHSNNEPKIYQIVTTITIHLLNFLNQICGWPVCAILQSFALLQKWFNINQKNRKEKIQNKEVEENRFAFCHIMWSVHVTTLRFMQKENRGAHINSI